MSKAIQMVLKCLAVLFAVGMLSGYVWTRQRAAVSESAASWAVDKEVAFPETPASPTLFDTSKSGKLTVDPILFSTSKSGPVDSNEGITLLIEKRENSVSKDPFAEVSENAVPGESPAPVLMPSSKSINMPIFDTRDIAKGKSEIEKMIQKAAGNQQEASRGVSE